MSVTSKCYGQFPAKGMNKEIDFDTDTIKVMLLENTYTPDQDTHDYVDDVSANEVSGTGYTAGGATISNASISYDSATNKTKLDADNVTWSSATLTARYAVIYCDTGVESTSALIAYLDFGQDITSLGGDFDLNFDDDGIVTFTVS